MIGANIGKFLNDVASLVENKKTTDIVDISNQSSKEGIRIVLELKRDADVENLTNMLYKKTTSGRYLRCKYAGGCRRTVRKRSSLKADHRTSCGFSVFDTYHQKIHRRFWTKSRRRQEIQEGLIKAMRCDRPDH